MVGVYSHTELLITTLWSCSIMHCILSSISSHIHTNNNPYFYSSIDALQSGGSINAAFSKNKSKSTAGKKKPTGESQYADAGDVGTFVDFSSNTSKGVQVQDPSAGTGAVEGKASKFLA